MESAGIANKIQLSQQTANLLEEAGKGHWLIARDDRIKAAGKGN
jgi:hypothetical protein